MLLIYGYIGLQRLDNRLLLDGRRHLIVHGGVGRNHHHVGAAGLVDLLRLRGIGRLVRDGDAALLLLGGDGLLRLEKLGSARTVVDDTRLSRSCKAWLQRRNVASLLLYGLLGEDVRIKGL